MPRPAKRRVRLLGDPTAGTRFDAPGPYFRAFTPPLRIVCAFQTASFVGPSETPRGCPGPRPRPPTAGPRGPARGHPPGGGCHRAPLIEDEVVSLVGEARGRRGDLLLGGDTHWRYREARWLYPDRVRRTVQLGEPLLWPSQQGTRGSRDPCRRRSGARFIWARRGDRYSCFPWGPYLSRMARPCAGSTSTASTKGSAGIHPPRAL